MKWPISDPLPPPVRRALAAVGGTADPLARIRALRRTLGPGDAALAAEQAGLGARAAAVLPGARDAVVTREGLEQASHPAAAAARAGRLARCLGRGALVLDATCGLGGDAIALAEAGLAVLLADRSPRRARLAAWNTRHLPGCLGTIVADARRPAARADAILLDPDRRRGGRRLRDPGAWSPSLSEALAATRGFAAACLKLAPGLATEAVDLPDGRAASWQWIGVAGELKETVLWLGRAATPEGPGGRRPREVLLLGRDGGETRFAASDEGGSAPAPLEPEEAAAVRWIAEPDPAVLRSGLLGAVARRSGLRPLAAELAYLGGAEPPPPDPEAHGPPLVRAWRVVASEALDRRRVRRLLASHGIGALTVKKRGHPATAEELARRLRGPGERRGVLLVARLARGHRAYLVEGG